jgi:hypothetical protein
VPWRSLLRVISYLALAFATMSLTGCSADCGWTGEGHAFLDANGNGHWEAGEPPLEGVQFSVKDVLSDVHGDGGTTDACGRVELYMWMPGCPDVKLLVFAKSPPGYRISTSASVTVHEDAQGIELVRFGFVPVEDQVQQSP